jgi:hypothetical protein
MVENHMQLNYFSGFAWALPQAFLVPLSECRFEEGDVIYDSYRAYEEPWEDSIHYINYSIQIQHPMRGTVSKIDSDKDSVFTDNWYQDVEFELTDYKSNTKKNVKSTQGRLYSLFWKGDLSVIDEANPSPSIPSLPRAAMNHLQKTVPFFKSKILASKLMNVDHLFIMPYDPTNDLLKLKQIKVNDALSRQFTLKNLCLTPQEAGLKYVNDFLPTFLIYCVAITSQEKTKIRDVLKDALYVPSSNKKTSKERFRLETHGYLADL